MPFHMGIGGGDSGGAQALNGLLSSLDQQARLAQQQNQQAQVQQQQDLRTQMEALNQGAVPAETQTVVPTPSGSAGGRQLIQRSAVPGQDQSRVVDIGGKRFYYPTAQEKAQNKENLDDTNSVIPGDDLSDRLAKGFSDWKPGTRIKPSELHARLEAINEGTKSEDPTEFFHTEDDDGTLHVFGQNKKTREVSEIGSGFPGAGKKKADKADPTQVDLEHFSTPISVNKSSGEITPLKLPPGVAAQATPGQQDVAQRFRERQQDKADAQSQRQQDKDRSDFEKESARHDNAMKAADAAHTRAQMYGDAMQSPNGETVIDPRTNQQVIMSDTRRKAYGTLVGASKSQALNYEGQAKQIRQQHQWGEFAPQQGAASPQAPAAAAPAAKPATAQAAPAPKTSGYIVGRSYRGIKYLGGDPNSQASWQGAKSN